MGGFDLHLRQARPTCTTATASAGGNITAGPCGPVWCGLQWMKWLDCQSSLIGAWFWLIRLLHLDM